MCSCLSCVFALGGQPLDSRSEATPRHPGTSVHVCPRPPHHAHPSERSEIHFRSARRYEEPEEQEDREFLPNAEGKNPVRFTDVGAGMDLGGWGWGGRTDQNQTYFMFSVRRKDFIWHVCLQPGQRNHGQRHPWISLCHGQHWHHLLLVRKLNTCKTTVDTTLLFLFASRGLTVLFCP